MRDNDGLIDFPAYVRAGDTVLYIYPEGDTDMVKIIALRPDYVAVELPNGKRIVVEPEDVGIDVDDLIVPVWD